MTDAEISYEDDFLPYGCVGGTLCTFSRIRGTGKRLFALFTLSNAQPPDRLIGWWGILGSGETEEEILLFANSIGKTPVKVYPWGIG